MTDQGFGQDQPDFAAAQGQGAAYPGPSAAFGPESPNVSSSSKSFFASLFDFGFNSFVTPKVVKVLYVLITIVVGLGALFLVFSGFRINAAVGLFFLIIVAPLFFFIYLALWRIALEIFIVVFRIADDLRAIRDRGGSFSQ